MVLKRAPRSSRRPSVTQEREGVIFVKIYHNPRCSKSRQTLLLLHEHGYHPEVVLYLEVGLQAEEVRGLAVRLGCGLHDLLRTKEAAYKEHGLSPKSSEGTIVQSMVSAPVLLERPVVVMGAKARVGRPPISVLELFDGASR